MLQRDGRPPPGATLALPEASLRALLLVPCLVAHAQAPILDVDRTRVDLGRIPPDRPVDLTFRLANAGGAPLRVFAVEPSCGCTTVDAEGFTLAPRAQRLLKVRLDPAGLPRVFRKSITVSSDDTTQPNLVLLIEGELAGKPDR